jgi:hypothetical protein
MSQETIQLAYDGEALRAGSMDVRDLAPALLSLGQLCERANDILNDGRAEINVRVRSDFKTGSFELSIDVTQTVLEIAKTIFAHKDHVSSAKDILELLGLLGIGKGLLSLIKWLKGRKATKTTALENGNIRIEIIDNSVHQHFDVRPEVIQLYNDEEIKKAIQGVIKPLERGDIDTFEVREGKETVEIIRLDDLPWFHALSEIPEDELIVDGERDAALTVIKPSFDNDLKWYFSDGENRFSATMEDRDFLKRLEKREIRFGQGDILIVRLYSRSLRTSKGLKTEHKVRKVLKVEPPPTQASLLPIPERDA